MGVKRRYYYEAGEPEIITLRVDVMAWEQYCPPYDTPVRSLTCWLLEHSRIGVGPTKGREELARNGVDKGTVPVCVPRSVDEGC